MKKTIIKIGICLLLAVILVPTVFAIAETERITLVEGDNQEVEVTVSEEAKEEEAALLAKTLKTLPDQKYECIRTMPNGEKIAFHHYMDKKYKLSTCTEEGFSEYHCDICDQDIHEDYPKQAHPINNDDKCVQCGEDLTGIIEKGEEYFFVDESRNKTEQQSDSQTANQIQNENDKEEAFNVENAYNNYIRMPTEYMRNSYLNKLSEENKTALLNYIEQKEKEKAEASKEKTEDSETKESEQGQLTEETSKDAETKSSEQNQTDEVK